jgi:hypothetical protein
MLLGKKQLAAMNQMAHENFHKRLIAFLREEIPEETASMDDAALRQRIVYSEQRAAIYGIRSEAGIAQFVCLTFYAGPEFDEIPDVKAFLETPDEAMTSEEKLDRLVEELASDKG